MTTHRLKTFFVTAQSGPVLQRLFLGNFYRLARERKDVRLVVFVEPDYFEVCQKRLAHERCIIEAVPAQRTGLAKIFLRFLAKASIPTETLKLRQKLSYLNGKSFLKFGLMRICWFLGHGRLWRALIRQAEYRLFYDDSFWAPYFDRYNPDAVLAAALLAERDTLLIKHARRRGVPSVGLPRGWDNFSSKLFLRAIPDILLAFNSVMPEEAGQYADVPRHKTRLVGFPQFDQYAGSSWHMSKEEVARRLGADPKKRWVSYFTSGGFLTGIVGKDHGDHMEMIRDAVSRGELPSDIEVVASVYPGYNVVFRKELSDVPTLRFGRDFYLNPEEGRLFMNFIRHSAVVLNFGSTVSLESAILDRPNITLGFNGKSDMGVPWQNKLSTTLDHVIHYRQLQDTGGVWRVANESELICAVKAYLENPGLHREGRRLLREKMVEPLDGKAGDRILETLLYVSLSPEKTFFVSAKKHAALRLFLASDFYKAAQDCPNVRLAVFVSPSSLAVYQKIFANERCIVQPTVRIKERTSLKKFFRMFCKASVPTATVRMVTKYDYVNHGSLLGFWSRNLFWALGHFKWWRGFLRFAEYAFFREDRVWKYYFDRYRPSAVFVPSAVTEADVVLLKYAKRRGISTIAMVNGWDNLTAKNSLRVHPDRMLVQNPSMIDDVVKLNDLPANNIRVIGFPWFDHYLDPSWQMTKQEVARVIGADSHKRWIGYFTEGAFAMKLTRTKDQGDHVEMLKNAISRGDFGTAEIIVSVHPGHQPGFKRDLGVPVLQFDQDFYFSQGGMKFLMNFIRHCDVVVNYGSTVMVEAAVFDRPIILIGFNGNNDYQLPWHRKISYTLDNIYHYALVQKTGGIWRVSNEGELIRAVKTYLADSRLHHEGRRVLRERIAGPIGKAGQSIIEELLSVSKTSCGPNTIFMTVQLGQELRDFMVGTFYEQVKSHPDVRLVVFMPPDKVEEMRHLFSNERCIIEPLVGDSSSRLKALFRTVCSYAMIPTRTVYERQRYAYLNGGSAVSFITKRVLWTLGHLGPARQLMRFVEYRFFHDEDVWRPYFEKYKPDVVFGTGGYREVDFTMFKFAKRSGIPTVLMCRSWDNLSTKAFIRVLPNLLLVQNPVMVEEAVRWHDISRGHVRLVGSPPYDHYRDSSWHLSREEVAKRIGIDPQKSWIGYFSGPLLTGVLGCEDRGEHIKMIQEAIRRGAIKNAEVIASLHPENVSVLREDQVSCPVLNLVKGWHFDAERTKLLVSFIRECAVITHFGSTISLDAAVLNTPIILIGFNGRDESKIPWQKKLSAAFDHTLHIQYLIRSGGMTRVSSEAELVSAINRYLENRALHQEGRRRLIEELVGPLDGKVGERVYEAVLSMIKRT